ncbi:hypothetical protein [Shewanella waksmanii]|uniref:hypothetical protein n=1 Tax=Shewanella waksmanii TaxID=213783 RepID=UPI00048ED103|nr:hypothetical protein [Shewanella waksmanii]
MFQILAFTITLFGAYLLYLTSRHQQFQAQPLKQRYRLLGYLLLAAALCCFYQSLDGAPALFMWLFTTATCLTLMPIAAILSPWRKAK